MINESQIKKILHKIIKEEFDVYLYEDVYGSVEEVGYLNEAGYQGRKVQLGKKKNNPERRKSFRARHNCDNPGPRWKPRYWACRTW